MSQQSIEPGASGSRVPRVSRRAWALATTVVVVVVAAGVWFATRQEVVPYDDPRSTGLLTLCDESGHAITEGKVDDTPFAPIVLGETPVDERVGADVVPIATLYGYQPREGVDPLEFSGSPIGGPVPFVDHDRPATRVVEDAWTLANFTEVFPADLDGYVQLRLLVSAPGFGTFTEAYDTADLVVDGDSWHLVRGGTADCSDAPSLLGE